MQIDIVRITAQMERNPGRQEPRITTDSTEAEQCTALLQGKDSPNGITLRSAGVEQLC